MLRRLLIVGILLASSISAQQMVMRAPAPSTFTVEKNIPYGAGNDHRFDLYHPAGETRVPVVITCNVGIPGMKDSPQYVGWGQAIAASGLAAVQYDAVGDPQMFSNFDALLATLQQRADELRIDPSRIVLWAGSTHVRLGLPLAMDRSRTCIRGAVLYYGTAEVSTIRTDLPVFFVRAGLDQPAFNQRIDAMLARALAANAPWTIENYGAGLHGFDVENDNDISRDVITRTLAFMNRVVQPAVSILYSSLGDDAALAAAFNGGKWDEAVAGYRKRVEANPDDADAHLRLGLSLYGAGRYPDALTEIEAAWTHGRRGFRDTGLPAARAAARNRNLTRALYWLDLLLSTPFISVESIRKDEAFARLVAEPAFAELLSSFDEQNGIIAALEAGNIEGGMRLLSSSHNPRFGKEEVLTSIGERLMDGGHSSEGLAVLEENTRRHARSAAAFDALSAAEERAGRSAASIAHAKRALKLDPSNEIRTAAQQRIARQNEGKATPPGRR